MTGHSATESILFSKIHEWIGLLTPEISDEIIAYFVSGDAYANLLEFWREQHSAVRIIGRRFIQPHRDSMLGRPRPRPGFCGPTFCVANSG